MTPTGSTPTISVIIPAYNAAAHLRAALESVLAQTVPVTEIVVVDDGSEDATAAIAATQERTRLIRKPHSGIAATLNRGLAEARGEVLAFLDADDLWTVDKIERQLPVLLGPAASGLVLGHARNFHSPELDADARQRIHCPPEPLPGAAFGTLLLRREIFDRIGPVNESWQIAHFIEWYARAQDLGLPTHMLPDVVLLRRLHASNVSRRLGSARPDFARVLKTVLDRRRSASPAAASPVPAADLRSPNP